MESTFEGIGWQDYLVIAVYFIMVLGVGLISSWKSKRDSMGGYFLASKSMHFIPVGASIFASNIGSGHFIGLAGTGAASGVGIAIFELSAIFFIVMLGWCFVPVYMASGVYTMPEYLRLRFGGQRIRIYLSVLALILYVFTKISADLYAGALFITQATQIKGDGAIYLAILILLAIACIFTIAGGLTAVIWTDFVQTILMIIGAFVVCGYAFSEVGGYEELIARFFEATAANRSHSVPSDPSSSLCGGVPEDSMHLFRSATPGASDLPWSGVVFGLSISSIWYWCSDQVIVQRALASKDVVHAKGGCILAGWLKLLPLWIMVLPGMAARALFPDEVACASPEACYEICQSEGGCTNLAFIKLVNELLPPGLRGVMLAVMLAALMSSLSSIFNSSSTIFTVDIYARIRPKAGETELLVVGRLFVLVLVVVSIIWIPIIQASQGSQLFVYIQSITSYLAPPICAVYILAVFWPRCNEPGAFWGLMGGLVVGLLRFVLEFSVTRPACGSDLPPPPQWWESIVGNIHYLHFGLLLWGISGIITIIVSLLTEPVSQDQLYRLTFKYRKSNKPWEKMANDEIQDAVDENKRHDGLANQSSRGELPTWRKVVNFLCGIQDNATASNAAPQSTMTPEQKAEQGAASIYEPKKWRWFVNFQAVLLMAAASFVLGFYA